MAAFETRMLYGDLIADPLSKVLPAGDKEFADHNEALEVAKAWQDFQLPGIEELAFLGRPSVKYVYWQVATRAIELRNKRRVLSETIQSLTNSSIREMRARTEPDYQCDFAGQKFGELSPEEIEQMSLTELQKHQSETAKRIQRGCRFGNVVAAWCSKAAPCSIIRPAQGGCEYCGRCKKDAKLGRCVFAAENGQKALKDCINELNDDLECFNAARQNLAIYENQLQIAQRAAEAKRPLLPIWRKEDFVEIGDEVYVLQSESEPGNPEWTARFVPAIVTGFKSAARSTSGLVKGVVVRIGPDREFTNLLRSACIVLPREHEYLTKHADFAELFVNAAHKSRSQQMRSRITAALRKST